MQALATPLVSILHGDRVFTFSRKTAADGGSEYVSRTEDLASLVQTRPGTVFEDGKRWALVPDKFYRYDDRHIYLSEQHPYVGEQQVGVLSLPTLKAMGVYDKNPDVPAGLHSGNHIAELLIHVNGLLSDEDTDVAQAFFLDGSLWLTLTREKQVVFSQSFKMESHADAVFWLATMMDFFGLDREVVPLYVGGLVDESGLLYRELCIYFIVQRLSAKLLAQNSDPAINLLLAYEHGLCAPADPILAS